MVLLQPELAAGAVAAGGHRKAAVALAVEGFRVVSATGEVALAAALAFLTCWGISLAGCKEIMVSSSSAPSASMFIVFWIDLSSVSSCK